MSHLSLVHRSRTLRALAVGLAVSASCHAADDGLFDEPALEVVLYGPGTTADRNYRFPEYRSLDVLTQRNDNNRSGASHWPGINQDTVRGFKLLGQLPVGSDAVVTAQPLYVGSARVKNAQQPVLIVATSENKVFAFAPSERATTPLWSTQLADPLVADDHPTEGAACDTRANAAYADTATTPVGYVGIEATPVVDQDHNQVLVGFKTSNGTQRLASIDLNDGAKRVVDVPTPGRGSARDWRRLHRNRASLLLVDGVVYLAFSSLCEGSDDLMHGSVVAFDARTLAHVGTFEVTDETTDGGGVWQASTGPAADTAGYVYFVTGNRRLGDPCLVKMKPQQSPFDALNLSNSVVRLRVDKRNARGDPPRGDEAYTLHMAVAGSFTPYRKMLGDCWDLDLGSAGPLLLPGTPYVVSGGKEGLVYVLDRFRMGGYDRAGPPWDYAGMSKLFDETRTPNLMHSHIPADDRNRDRVKQKFQVGVNRYDADYEAKRLMKWPHIHGTPAFARFDDRHAYLFVWPEKDALKRYEWTGDGFDTTPRESREWAPRNVDEMALNGMPGGFVSVNIDHTGTLRGVVFASVKICENDGPRACSVSQDAGILRAYDPFTMQMVWSNLPETYTYRFAKFVSPTVANGRVFLATASGKVLVYGPPQ